MHRSWNGYVNLINMYITAHIYHIFVMRTLGIYPVLLDMFKCVVHSVWQGAAGGRDRQRKSFFQCFALQMSLTAGAGQG